MKLFFIQTITFLVSILSVATAESVLVQELHKGDPHAVDTAALGGGLRRLATTPIKFFAVLSRAQNVDTCTSTANGMGNAVLTYLNRKLCVLLGFGGISGAEIASHIHGPASIGASGGVLFSFTSRSTVKKQCFTLTAAQELRLLAGSLYINIHTAKCPNGEIRGQIMCAVA